MKVNCVKFVPVLLASIALVMSAGCSSSTDDDGGAGGSSVGGGSHVGGTGGSSEAGGGHGGTQAGGSGGTSQGGSGGTSQGGSGGTSQGGSGGTSQGGSGGRASDDPFAKARQLCVEITNDYRKSVGVPPLARRTDKESCADSQCKSDSAAGKAHGAFRKCGERAQNECPGWPASDPIQSMRKCLQQMFDEGPGEPYSEHGHYINMTSTKYKSVACGFYNASGKLWIIQDFYP